MDDDDNTCVYMCPPVYTTGLHTQQARNFEIFLQAKIHYIYIQSHSKLWYDTKGGGLEEPIEQTVQITNYRFATVSKLRSFYVGVVYVIMIIIFLKLKLFILT